MESGNWSRMFCDEIEWKGRLYFAVGDMSTNGYRSVRIFLFNKALHAQNQFEDIYTLVREGKWTLDKMNSMATTAADLNGDSQMTAGLDRWGMAWQSAISGYTLFYGAGTVCAVRRLVVPKSCRRIEKQVNKLIQMTANKYDALP